jgi:cytosine/adenosine deaminase-related metal-dependent hydrolase
MMAGDDLLITGGIVVDPAAARADRLDVLVRGGTIAQIGAPGTLAIAGVAVHDATDRLILPGLVNAHTHGHANLMKGVADRWTLEASLTNGPWLGGARDPDTMYLSTLLGAADMVSKGCTACFDLVFEFPRPTAAGFAAVAQAYADVGMRAVLAPMIADKTLFHAIPGLLDALPVELRQTVGRFNLGGGDETIAAVEAIAASRDKLPEGIAVAIAPTIPHHCSERFLTQCADIANRHKLHIHMHVAESRLQVLAAHKLYGTSPVSSAFCARASSQHTRSGSTTAISTCWRRLGPRSPTSQRAICGSAPASRRCVRCWTAASRLGLRPTAPIPPMR